MLAGAHLIDVQGVVVPSGDFWLRAWHGEMPEIVNTSRPSVVERKQGHKRLHPGHEELQEQTCSQMGRKQSPPHQAAAMIICKKLR